MGGTYAASDVLPVAEDGADERGPDQNEYGLHKLMFEDTFEWYQRSGRAEADAIRFDWSFEDALLQELR